MPVSPFARRARGGNPCCGAAICAAREIVRSQQRNLHVYCRRPEQPNKTSKKTWRRYEWQKTRNCRGAERARDLNSWGDARTRADGGSQGEAADVYIRGELHDPTRALG